MSWKVRLLCLSMASIPLPVLAGGLQSELIPLDHVVMTDGPAAGVVFLMSDEGGWSARDDMIAAKLKAQKIAVVGVDMPEYVAAINAQAAQTQKADPYDPVCSYLTSDVESLSQQIQRASGSNDYVMPIVAGTGQGGGLALDIETQTPDVTVGGTVVANPASAVPITNDLCTPAGYLTQSRGEIYTLPSGKLEDPATIILGPDVSNDVRARVEDFHARAKDVTIIADTDPTVDVMATQIAARISAARAAMAALPVTVLPAKPKHDVLAIILSGDGGWRDIDQSIGQMMQSEGIPVVGLDSLRYFWSKRTPQETARDLATLIKHYHDAWAINNVILVGYSFGADVLPAAYNLMPEAQRNRVKLISLLGLSKAADWEITVDGWMGSHGSAALPTLPDVAQMPLHKVMCVYGADEEDSGCPDAAKLGVEAIKVAGGHHFNDNYKPVEKDILDAFARRTEMVATTVPVGPTAKP
ncbi:MAG: virulence factor family protein [Paracoccaceae bacterium]|nr:virulence factor family protein [Paracoccaceae bacterium]